MVVISGRQEICDLTKCRSAIKSTYIPNELEKYFSEKLLRFRPAFNYMW